MDSQRACLGRRPLPNVNLRAGPKLGELDVGERSRLVSLGMQSPRLWSSAQISFLGT